jgi:hypothetical protein
MINFKDYVDVIKWFLKMIYIKTIIHFEYVVKVIHKLGNSKQNQSFFLNSHLFYL